MESVTQYAFCLAAMLMLSVSCDQSPQEKVSRDEIQTIANTINACIGWAKEKDLDLLFRVVAQDSFYLSVHPTDNVVRGFDNFKKNVPNLVHLVSFKYRDYYQSTSY